MSEKLVRNCGQCCAVEPYFVSTVNLVMWWSEVEDQYKICLLFDDPLQYFRTCTIVLCDPVSGDPGHLHKTLHRSETFTNRTSSHPQFNGI